MTNYFRKRMKVFALLLMCTFSTLVAQTQQRVTLNLKKASLTQVFKAIESQTTYRFFYKNKIIDQTKDINISAKDETIVVVLNQILPTKKLQFKILSSKSIGITELKMASLNNGKKIIHVNGKVIDENGEPIIGAIVTENENKSNGTISDFNGDFNFSLSKNNSFSVSYLGYQPEVISSINKANFTITLKANTKVLDEVVVVGYGTQKKVNLTGAVGMVKSEALESRPVQNVAQALQGVVPGLNFSVNNNGGELDNSLNFNIRGSGTIGDGSSSSPLVLIDGIEGNMNTLNPSDIKTVSVLKDAASASIYGARAAFGVILITTKSGKSGETKVNYTFNTRFADATNIPNMMDGYQFAQYFNAAASNSGQSPVFSTDVMDRIQQYQAGTLKDGTQWDEIGGSWKNYSGANADTDWFKTFYKNWVPSTEQNVSISGGSEKVQYHVSGSYLNQNGLLKFGKDKFNRFTFNGKITTKLYEWATLTYNSKFTREKYNKPSYVGLSNPYFFHNIARRWPVNPLRDNNGFLMAGMEAIELQDGGNYKKEVDYNTQQAALVLEPIKDWQINIEGSIRTTTFFSHWDQLQTYSHDKEGDLIPYGTNSSTHESTSKENYYTTNIYTSYFKQLGGHYVRILGGFNAELTKNRNLNGSKNTLISQSITAINGATLDPKIYGGYNHNSVCGFFGRINYNYQEKYLLEVNGRYDGSSRYVGSKRWGFFPSVSTGWNISHEDFFKDFGEKTQIGTLKIRGSWGKLGNMNTKSWYPFYQTMPTGSDYNWLVDGNRINWADTPGLISMNNTWETIETLDIGLDWGAFNNRLTGSFDWFSRKTNDMIGPAPDLSASLGTSVPKVNNCNMKSYGFELELGWRDHINDFKYGIKFVLSDSQQEVTRYPNESMDVDRYYNGRKFGEIWGLTTIGIAQTDEEMTEHLSKVDQSSVGSNWQAGDIMYKDLNGDGKINSGENTKGNSGDYSIIGNSTPRYNYGVTLDAAWKGFDFRCFLQGVAKRDYWTPGPYMWGALGQNMWQAAAFAEHWNFWRPEGDPLGANTNAYYPRVAFNGGKNTQTQSRYLQNAAYLRVKNIQLGYTLPRDIVSMAGLSGVRVYVSGDNLLTFTSMSDIFDPEALDGFSGNSGKLYPLQKVISVGVNVNF